MSAALLYGIAQFLAVVACCFGGGLGGYLLARPQDALDMVGLGRRDDSALGLSEARAFGGLLLLGHAGAAATLGYAPSVGAVMAFTLALLWLGAAAGRIASLVMDKPGVAPEQDGVVAPPAALPPQGQWSSNRGLLSFDLLMAVSLALPLWMLVAPMLRHSGMQV